MTPVKSSLPLTIASREEQIFPTLTPEQKAIADRKKAIELEPRNPTNYAQMGSIGLALTHLDRARDAIAAYDEAIRMAPAEDRPRLAEYYLRRSQAWRGLKERERALADAQAARRLGADVDSTYIRQLEKLPTSAPLSSSPDPSAP